MSNYKKIAIRVRINRNAFASVQNEISKVKFSLNNGRYGDESAESLETKLYELEDEKADVLYEGVIIEHEIELMAQEAEALKELFN